MKFKSLLLIMILALGAFAVFPASAQVTGTNTVSYNGFTFNIPTSVASNVNIIQTAGEPTTLEQPGGPNVQHTEFVLYNGTEVPQDYFGGVGSVHVYNTGDFAGYTQASQEYQTLQTVLSQHPDLTQYMVPDTGTNANNLPYLPAVGAAQAIRARANYVDTAWLSGVTYITVFRSDVSPFTGSEFLYTFQGASKDGQYYVSAIFSLNTSLFPAQIPSDFDEANFEATLNDYMTQSIATLNGGQPTDFTPSLSDLDALIQSLSFGSMVVVPPGGASQATMVPSLVPPIATVPVTIVPTAVNTDPTLGGLANKTWTLVSYGDPAAPTPVVAGAQPVTLVFSSTGVSGSGGCNSYGGSFQYDGSASTISFSQIISTLIACDQPINDQEHTFFDALSKTTTYVLNGNQLQISYDGGVLTFNGA